MPYGLLEWALGPALENAGGGDENESGNQGGSLLPPRANCSTRSREGRGTGRRQCCIYAILPSDVGFADTTGRAGVFWGASHSLLQVFTRSRRAAELSA